jgi:hypothetical protein
MNPPHDLAAVVGANARRMRLRADAKTDDVAKLAREFGLTKWKDANVSALERGRVSPTVPTLYVLGLVFSELLGEPVTLADLCECEDNVQVADELAVPGEAITNALRGSPIDRHNKTTRDFLDRIRIQRVKNAMSDNPMVSVTVRDKLPHGLRPGDIGRAVLQVGLAEQRAAKDLGVDPDQFAAFCLLHYGRTFAEERDRRAGLGANAQKLGQVVRAMKDELRPYMPNDGETSV